MFEGIHGPVSAVSKFRGDHVQEAESMISLQRLGEMMPTLLLLASGF